MQQRRALALLLAALLAFGGVAAACSDDDDSSSDTTASEADDSGSDDGGNDDSDSGGSGDASDAVERYCDAVQAYAEELSGTAIGDLDFSEFSERAQELGERAQELLAESPNLSEADQERLEECAEDAQDAFSGLGGG